MYMYTYLPSKNVRAFVYINFWIVRIIIRIIGSQAMFPYFFSLSLLLELGYIGH